MNLLKPSFLYEKITGPWGRILVIALPFLFLVAFFLLPFLIVTKISFSDVDNAVFKDLLVWSDGIPQLKLKFSNYLFIAQDELYLFAYLSSLKFAGITTVLCLFLAYPFAYFMARCPASQRPALLMLVMLPFWTSFLLRVYAWKLLLADNGVFNNAALFVGLINEPIKMLNTPFSLLLGMVYTYLPFMILPLYANLVKMDLRLLEAAFDLGATPWQAFWRITVPLSKRGVVAGSLLVFIPCVGEFVIPELLGGPQTLMIGRVLWDEFFSNNDWPMASSVAVMMVLLVIVPIAFFSKYQAENSANVRI
jgi:putrescine transport system permease protein